MENFAEAKISLRGESEEERKFFNESFREVRELIKKIYSTRSNRELDLIDPTWSPTFIAIHLFPLSLSLLVSMHARRNKYKDVDPFFSRASMMHSIRLWKRFLKDPRILTFLQEQRSSSLFELSSASRDTFLETKTTEEWPKLPKFHRSKRSFLVSKTILLSIRSTSRRLRELIGPRHRAS